jgi:MYXO-CTERM domain-containing protein
MKKILGSVALAACLVAGAPDASAFCGFYVGGAGTEMFNNATQVVLMRVGTRTVMSMQNNYQGPPTDFAMVVPVPVVLQEENVKTLPREVFSKVDAMGAPRLVEYWEVDPCSQYGYYDDMMMPRSAAAPEMAMAEGDAGHGVTIEAKFEVGEYQVLILSAKESTGLETWLKEQKYAIPDKAEPLLRPYVEGGSKFFVAKVDPKKVRFENGMATLSPLRFHFDSEEFSLPIRLGLANSAGTQDLIVNILSPSRYEVANYGNVTIPTNLEVKDEVRNRFGEFYAALFDRTVEVNPGAVITEYAWDAMTCDPCPGPTLDWNDLATLGTDVVQQNQPDGMYYGGFTLTRLHARYGAKDMKEDLVFKEAPAIVGGREHVIDPKTGKLEEGATPSDVNNFQGRYIIRHEWTGAIACENPVRGRWGGPPPGVEIAADTKAATNIAMAPRGGVELPMLVAQDVPEIEVQEGVPLPRPPKVAGARGCGCASGGGTAGAAALSVLVGLLLLRRKRS